MSPKKRKFLVIFLSLVCLISVPLLILESSGWRIDFKRKKLVLTGGVSLKTNQVDASVFLNGK
ncbi:hypothetical protein H5T58_02845, partial [Candidatus Parcubacteria bacterium]|nr:hypothetical protein [Candidatus Parcubacteria bacterium]